MRRPTPRDRSTTGINGACDYYRPTGKILDYIDALTQRKETPEEYVRQEIAKSLVREYDYEKQEISVEFTLRLGSRRPRADLVIFMRAIHTIRNRACIIIECKSQKIKSTARKDGVGQLKSYMAACPNVAYGMWTNGIERFCYRRIDTAGKVVFEETPDIPGKGRTEDEVTRPRFRSAKGRFIRCSAFCISPLPQLHRWKSRTSKIGSLLGAAEDHLLQDLRRAQLRRS